MSKLLINEHPLQVLPSLACKIGLNEAIFLQQLHYWLQNPKMGKFVGGEKWLRNTIDEWQTSNFPFWSRNTIDRTVKRLEKKRLIWTRDDLNQANYDKTKWYRVNYDKLAEIEKAITQNGEWVEAITQNGTAITQNGTAITQSGTAITQNGKCYTREHTETTQRTLSETTMHGHGDAADFLKFVNEPTRSKLLELGHVTPEYAEAWQEWHAGGEFDSGLRNPAGWAVQAIRAGEWPPEPDGDSGVEIYEAPAAPPPGLEGAKWNGRCWV